MANFWEVVKFVLRTFPVMVTDLRYILILGVVFLLVYRQHRKILIYEKRMFGLVRIQPFIETCTAMVYGIVGGLVATALFVALGISLTDTGIAYLWITSLILMLIHPRFLCFSYAGGLISLSSILLGYPQLNVPSVMALVAILHLVEAFLIAINGYHNASPMYIKHPNGKVVGGFTLQKSWPVPFIALLGIAILETSIDIQSFPMPDWWPIFKPGGAIPANHTIVYVLFPIVAALGYSDFAITSLPKEKARWSAGTLFLFSAALLSLAVLGNHYPRTAILAALFSPLGHELVIYFGQKREKSKSPVFSCDDGVMVLAVYPNSPAEKMGLKTGDVIRGINGTPIPDLPTLMNEMSPWLIDPVFEVENAFHSPKRRTIAFKGKVPPLGLIPTPNPNQGIYVQIKESPVKLWLRRFRTKRK